MAQYAKQKNPEKWLSNRSKASDASGSGVKIEEGVNVNSHIPTTVSLVHDAGQSLGPGGKKLRAVDSGMNGLFGDDDDDDLDFKRKREREYGADGDGDEIDFEEDFADDEEKNPEEADDDEAKELEVCVFQFCTAIILKSLQERLKKEYRKAGVTKQADFVEDSDDEDDEKLTGAGKAMKKMLKKSDKNGQYDNSDDEKNPYASSVSDPGRSAVVPDIILNRRRKRRRLIPHKHGRDRQFKHHRLAQDLSILVLHLHPLLPSIPNHSQQLRAQALVRRLRRWEDIPS